MVNLQTLQRGLLWLEDSQVVGSPEDVCASVGLECCICGGSLSAPNLFPGLIKQSTHIQAITGGIFFPLQASAKGKSL